jgi:hypothetical protein
MSDHDEALDAEAFAQRAEHCQQAMKQFAWLAGSWLGYGTHGGESRVCHVEARFLFDGTFLESRERIYTPSGELEHEDLTIFGAAPESGPSEFYAVVYMPGGLAVHYGVEVNGDSILCEPEEFGARLSLLQTGNGYRARVFYPDEEGTWFEDAVIDYEPRL